LKNKCSSVRCRNTKTMSGAWCIYTLRPASATLCIRLGRCISSSLETQSSCNRVTQHVIQGIRAYYRLNWAASPAGMTGREFNYASGVTRGSNSGLHGALHLHLAYSDLTLPKNARCTSKWQENTPSNAREPRINSWVLFLDRLGEGLK
jgi:hypothetical protein